MGIHEAVAAIIGDQRAHDITMDQGIHWAVVAAMAEATTDHDPEAIAFIRSWNARQKAASFEAGEQSQ